MKLQNGMGQTVICTESSIKKALRDTDLVIAEGTDISIANFYSDDGDEIDVTDGYDHTVYQPDELNAAIADFLLLL